MTSRRTLTPSASSGSSSLLGDFDPVGWFLDNWLVVLIGAVVAGILGFAAWGLYEHWTAPTKGTVHNKLYQPAYTSVSCSTVGKSTTCYPIYHPADYEFDLYDGSQHGWRWVTPAAYDRYAVGQWYPG